MRWIALLLALSAACTVRNPEYCDSNGDCAAGKVCNLGDAGALTHACVPGADAGPPDAPLPPDAPAADAAIPCADAGSCPAPFPICRAGVCSGCAMSSECPVSSPVCSSSGACDACTGDPGCDGHPGTPHCLSGACVACRADAECNTFCDTDTGACVPDGDVLFVTPGGLGPTCKETAPCGSIGAALALATGGKWIHIDAGTYAESLTIAGSTVHLVGPGALVVPTAGSPGAAVSGTSMVTIRGLGFHDGSADGIVCTGGSPSTTRLRLTGVSLKGNSGVGLRASQCAVVVEQTMVSGNGHQGLLISDSLFDVRNTVVAGNSDGVVLTNPAAGANHLDFSTIANNINSGVACSGPSPTLTFDSNIVYGNGGGVQVSGGICTWIFSDIGPTGIGGATNINASPMFIDSSFHIATTSPCVNAGDTDASPAVDIDGQPRPAGAAPDIGADEAN